MLKCKYKNIFYYRFISYSIKLPNGWKAQKSEEYYNVHLTE